MISLNTLLSAISSRQQDNPNKCIMMYLGRTAVECAEMSCTECIMTAKEDDAEEVPENKSDVQRLRHDV